MCLQKYCQGNIAFPVKNFFKICTLADLGYLF